MEQDFEHMTPLSGVGALVVLAGLAVVAYGQFHVSIIEATTGAIGGGAAERAPDVRSQLAHYRSVRGIGVTTIAAGAVVVAFDLLGGTDRVLTAVREE